ncbi:uracil-DNA glycosylase [Ancylomarina longa]|uniref:Uracil-DNA glycosylase n=1 Tax=Ancylomarina longa TaxID=2487017 RepID=A0A434AG79_9BACT|nr:uracil-DNA glycosylase [Ancylomarina longa]RUT73391.1 uracil-DNA glycosylase [Ancylomarina longa]
MGVTIEKAWKQQLESEFSKMYFKDLIQFVKSEYATKHIYPPGKLIFNAFDKCPFDQVKVVILGQDPYHGLGQANGLCFSVQNGVAIPPSLKNIFKEMNADLEFPIPQSGNLENWSKQGILLLNATLTVRANQAGSHQNRGWEAFTDAVVKCLSEKKENLVFMLWGAYAQQKGKQIDASKHLILRSAHPSPFSAEKGFFGNRHFSKANKYLKEKGKGEINWKL